MKKRRIIIIATSLVGVVILLYLGMIFIGGGIISGALFNPRINQEQMERIFVEDFNFLIVIANYLADSEHASVHSFSERKEGHMSVFSDDFGLQQIPISDERAINAAETLRERGYTFIFKSNNLIRFVRWSSMNRGRGIAFATEGEPDESILPIFTIMEPLSKEGWFFYEQD